jgi:hypothetical protein
MARLRTSLDACNTTRQTTTDGGEGTWESNPPAPGSPTPTRFSSSGRVLRASPSPSVPDALSMMSCCRVYFVSRTFADIVVKHPATIALEAVIAISVPEPQKPCAGPNPCAATVAVPIWDFRPVHRQSTHSGDVETASAIVSNTHGASLETSQRTLPLSWRSAAFKLASVLT